MKTECVTLAMYKISRCQLVLDSVRVPYQIENYRTEPNRTYSVLENRKPLPYHTYSVSESSVSENVVWFGMFLFGNQITKL